MGRANLKLTDIVQQDRASQIANSVNYLQPKLEGPNASGARAPLGSRDGLN
jgi:hypothetical protein